MAYDDIKITKEQGFTLSIESTFLKKAQDEGQIDRPLPRANFLSCTKYFYPQRSGKKIGDVFQTWSLPKIGSFLTKEFVFLQ